MPLTQLQEAILAVLGPSRSADSYLAGGAALHFSPNSTRFSHDLDLFHDAAAQVAEAFEKDRTTLVSSGFELELVLSQPGFIRAVVRRGGGTTQIDWAQDSAWRFMPLVRQRTGGYLLHPIDLATNKALTLAGRDEVRDFVDILYVMDAILPLGALVWAAVGKDPGFTPLSLLEQLKRRGRNRPEEVERLDLARPFDVIRAKETWLAALEEAEAFVLALAHEEPGCLFYDAAAEGFRSPDPHVDLSAQGLQRHFPRPGGVLPRPADQRVGDDDGLAGLGPNA